MRIALDATPLVEPAGGLARYVAELALALAQNQPDDEVHLLSDQTELWWDPRLESLPNVRREPGSGWARSKWWSLGLPLELRRRRIDVFHGTDFAVPYVPVTPSVMTLHDLSPWKPEPLRPPGSERVRRRTPRLLRLARRVITPTEAIRREAIAAFGLAPERVQAVHHAPSEALAAPEPARAGALRAALGAPPRYLLAIGAGNERKNIPCLVEAWKKARRSDAELGLVIVGAGAGRYAAEGCAALLALELADDEQTAALLSGALAFVYPSLYEGFGLPVVEAMRSGVPVLASQDPAVVEAAGGAAWHFDARSSDELAGLIGKLASDPAAAESLRMQGYRRAAELSWRKTAEATRKIYEQVLGRV
ncbi:MAG: glycosyltransferase [Acidobacteria bacterium]|nr:glycosyltransferase [Acidobacteriota bacterium]